MYSIKSTWLEYRYGFKRISKGVVIRGISDSRNIKSLYEIGKMGMRR